MLEPTEDTMLGQVDESETLKPLEVCAEPNADSLESLPAGSDSHQSCASGSIDGGSASSAGHTQPPVAPPAGG